jgi:GT2 family glycosyltransferase
MVDLSCQGSSTVAVTAPSTTERKLAEPGAEQIPHLRIIPDITVIIPTVGRSILQRCLESLCEGTVLPGCIVVIDQGQNTSVAEWVSSMESLGMRAIHLRSGKRSPASARNLGIGQVQTTFVAAIDDDCVVDQHWLEKIVACLRQNPTTIVTGRLEPVGDGTPPTVVTSRVPHIYVRPSFRILSPLASANMGFARDTARRIGLFDEKLFTAEENDWAYRALRLGISIMYSPELVVYHIHWRDRSQVATTYRSYAWCQGAFYGKHLRSGDWSMLLRTGISLFRGARSFTKGVLNKDHELRVNGFARLSCLLPGVVAGLRRVGPE